MTVHVCKMGVHTAVHGCGKFTFGPPCMQRRHCKDCMDCCLSFMQDWQKLSPRGPDSPMDRWGHGATCFTSCLLDIQSILLLILGGYPYEDFWLCDVRGVKWMLVSLVCEKVFALWWHQSKIKSMGHRKYKLLLS